MGKPHPIELRKRVVDYVEEGHSHRSAASRFCVSIKFVNDMVKLKRETGALEPKRQGRAGHGKLASVTGWICLLYTSPSPRDRTRSRMPSSA